MFIKFIPEQPLLVVLALEILAFNVAYSTFPWAVQSLP